MAGTAFSSPLRPRNVIPNWQSNQAKGLIGWWPLLDGGGTTARDYAPTEKHDGVGQSSFLASNWENGPSIYGGATIEGAVNDHFLMGDQAIYDFATTDFSLTGWVRTTETGTRHHLLNKKISHLSANPGWGIQLVSDDLQAHYSDGTTQVNIETATTGLITDGQWHFIAYVASRTVDADVFLWIDNFEPVLAAGATANANDITNTRQLTFGARGDNTDQWIGGIADFRLYNRVLLRSELAAMFTPATRWELYERPRRTAAFVAEVFSGELHNPIFRVKPRDYGYLREAR